MVRRGSRGVLRSAAKLLVVTALVLLPRGGAEGVNFQSLQDLQTGIGFTTVLEFGPEDPFPASNADGCIYAVNGGQGAVHRICFDASIIPSFLIGL